MEQKLTETKTVEPKTYAQKCPVCNGFGSLKYGSKVCQGCNGRGWILVPVDREKEL